MSRSAKFFIKSLDRNVAFLDAVNSQIRCFDRAQAQALGDLLAKAVRRESPEGAHGPGHLLFDRPVEMTIGAVKTIRGGPVSVHCLERQPGSSLEIGLQFDKRSIYTQRTLNVALSAGHAKRLRHLLVTAVSGRRG